MIYNYLELINSQNYTNYLRGQLIKLQNYTNYLHNQLHNENQILYNSLQFYCQLINYLHNYTPYLLKCSIKYKMKNGHHNFQQIHVYKKQMKRKEHMKLLNYLQYFYSVKKLIKENDIKPNLFLTDLNPLVCLSPRADVSAD